MFQYFLCAVPSLGDILRVAATQSAALAFTDFIHNAQGASLVDVESNYSKKFSLNKVLYSFESSLVDSMYDFFKLGWVGVEVREAYQPEYEDESDICCLHLVEFNKKCYKVILLYRKYRLDFQIL